MKDRSAPQHPLDVTDDEQRAPAGSEPSFESTDRSSPSECVARSSARVTPSAAPERPVASDASSCVARRSFDIAIERWSLDTSLDERLISAQMCGRPSAVALDAVCGGFLDPSAGLDMRVVHLRLILLMLAISGQSALAQHIDAQDSRLDGVDLAPETAPSQDFGKVNTSATQTLKIATSSSRPVASPESPIIHVAANRPIKHRSVQKESPGARVETAKVGSSARRVATPTLARNRPPRAEAGVWVSPWRRAFINRWGHEPPVPPNWKPASPRALLRAEARAG